MDERRRSKRLNLESALIIKRLDGGPEAARSVVIEVMDISKTGLGFQCVEMLELGSLYDAKITLWTKEIIRCCVEIVREDMLKDTFVYGAIFIGMVETDSRRIEIYDWVVNRDDQDEDNVQDEDIVQGEGNVQGEADYQSGDEGQKNQPEE